MSIHHRDFAELETTETLAGQLTRTDRLQRPSTLSGIVVRPDGQPVVRGLNYRSRIERHFNHPAETPLRIELPK